jgi:hypothetical protein
VGDLYKDGHPTNGIAPDSYTPPSHTQIAKDHGPVSSPTDEDHHHHEASWLNPLAEQVAGDATEAIGVKVSRAWDVVDAGGTPSDSDLQAIDGEVDRWFDHPAANQGLWQARVQAMFGNAQFGPELLEHLRTSQPSSPLSPP